jgi:hypothetical protein
MSIVPGRYLRREAAAARAARQRGDGVYTAAWSFEPRNRRQLRAILPAVGEIIAAVEKEGWVHVETEQLFSNVFLHFIRA